MNTLCSAPRGISTISRAVLLSAIITGVCGAIAGLAIGLGTYAPTAWFAMIELALPSAALGAVGGLLTGSLLVASRHVVHCRRS